MPMYRYDTIDRALVRERVAQFRDQTRRFLDGEMSEDEFRHLRLRNGLYIQTPRADAASGDPVRLAVVATAANAGFHRATLRPRLRAFHHAAESAIQLAAPRAGAGHPRGARRQSRCTRSRPAATASATRPRIPLAGVAADELEDPRPWCEIIRQWSTFHPEFTYLPRKFKIAVTGSPDQDRAATLVHDIGVHIVRGRRRRARLSNSRRRRARAHAGDRPGDPRVPAAQASAVLPRGGAARLQPRGPARQHPQGEDQDPGPFARARGVQAAGGKRVAADQGRPARDRANPRSSGCAASSRRPRTARFPTASPAPAGDAAFRAWYRYNTVAHKVSGYRAVYVSLKKPDVAPGDATDAQLDLIADLADRYSFGEAARDPHAEFGARRRGAGRSVRAVARARRGRAWPRRTSAP